MSLEMMLRFNHTFWTLPMTMLVHMSWASSETIIIVQTLLSQACSKGNKNFPLRFLDPRSAIDKGGKGLGKLIAQTPVDQIAHVALKGWVKTQLRWLILVR